MNRILTFLAVAAYLLLNAPAHAAVDWTVEALLDGVPSSGMIFPISGSRITLDITLRSDGEPIFALGASGFGYDQSVVSLVPSESVIPSSVLVQLGTGPGMGFGGIGNTVTELSEAGTANNGYVRFFAGVTGAGVISSGASDISPVNGLLGGPQFRLVFDIVGVGFTTIGIGIDTTYGDGLILASGVNGVSNNAYVLIGMPEPSVTLLVGLGLAALAGTRRSGPTQGRRRESGTLPACCD